ncbi:MAG: hypothetical protein IT460_14630 [Planctomycetes bacterium]|nr:hypothetical protein [Planctomycetota bacterium]
MSAPTPSPRRLPGSPRWWCAALLPVVLASVPRASTAGDPPSPAREAERQLNDARHDAIRRGCAWIAAKQRTGGAFGDDKGIVAISALSTLALMSGGSGVGRGPHGAEVRRGVRYLVGLGEASKTGDPQMRGYFRETHDRDSRMHGHGYATLALASALSSADPELAASIRDVLRGAIECAERSQTATGGWGYDPTSSQEHEGSVTVTIVQGLRAARDAGLRVSLETVRKGLGYLRRSQKSDGSFKYSIQQDRSTYALTAAAVSSFYLLGEYGGDEGDAQRIDDGVRFLSQSLSVAMKTRQWYSYGHFYAAWAGWQRDGSRGETSSDREDGPGRSRSRTEPFWGPWHDHVYPALLAQQRSDGSWADEEPESYRFGDLLTTSFSVLTLAIPDELLPIFQR